MSEAPPVRGREQRVQAVLDITLQPLYVPGDGYVDSKRKEAERIVDALLPQPDPELVAGMRELGYRIGRNPDGVDDSVATTLLVVRGLRDEVKRLQAAQRGQPEPGAEG